MLPFGAVGVRRNTLNLMCLCPRSTKSHSVEFSVHTPQACWSWDDLHCCSAPLVHTDMHIYLSREVEIKPLLNRSNIIFGMCNSGEGNLSTRRRSKKLMHSGLKQIPISPFFPVISKSQESSGVIRLTIYVSFPGQIICSNHRAITVKNVR